MDNVDINKLLEMLGNVNKQDLKNAVNQANKIMNSKNKEQLIDELKKKIK